VVFQTDYDEIEHYKYQLRRHFSDAIIITSPKNVIRIMSQIFPFWAPPNKISGHAHGAIYISTSQMLCFEIIIY